MQEAVAGLALIIGALIAFFVGRSIIKPVGKMSDISGDVANSIDQQGAATREIARNVGEAAKGTSEVVGSITEVNRYANETGAASSQMLSAAKSLSAESNRLKSEMESFLHAIRTGLAERRKGDDPSYAGPERRKGDRGQREPQREMRRAS